MTDTMYSFLDRMEKRLKGAARTAASARQTEWIRPAGCGD